MKEKKALRIILPKGSLQKDTLSLFEEAGYVIDGYRETNRSYRPTLDDGEIELKISRPQEIPMYVDEGGYDAGISGLDWIMETRSSAVELMDLKYGAIQIVMATMMEWEDVGSFDDLLRLPRKEIRISTEYLNIATQFVIERTEVEPSIVTPWLRKRRHRESNVTLTLSFGATEGKPPEDAEAIIDNATFSARTIQENGLKIIERILPVSTARLIANRESLRDGWKREKLDELVKRFERVGGGRETPANPG
ncbi:MAG: ATP phosphoribosyltransferase [bacterium]